MPILSGLIDPSGLYLDVRVGLSAVEIRRRRNAGEAIPAPISLRAIIDTGADSTCVDGPSVASLGLEISGITLANRPALGGLGPVIEYDVSLTLIHPSGDPRKDFVLRAYPVIELPLGSLGFQALIGRDFLSQCQLFYDGPGNSFSLAY
jgi:hypothetical protein